LQWSQLKVGISVVAASVTLAVLIFLMSGTGDRPTKAIIKSGGFLGLGSKLIVVDFASLRPGPNQTNNVLSPGVLVVSGLTREQVRQMDSFHYDSGMRTYRPSGL